MEWEGRCCTAFRKSLNCWGGVRRRGYGVGVLNVGASTGLVIGTLLDIVTPSQAVTALSRHIVFQVEVIQ